MKLANLIPAGLLIAAGHVQYTAGDVYTDSLGFEVHVARPHILFATDPPMGKCADGLLYILADGLGLDRGWLDETLGPLLDMLGPVLGINLKSEDASGYFGPGVATDFNKAMDDAFRRTSRSNSSGLLAYDTRDAFRGIWHAQESVLKTLDFFSRLGKDERIAMLMALPILAAKRNQLPPEERIRLEEMLAVNFGKARCTDVAERESGALCEVTRDDQPSSRAGTVENLVLTALHDMISGLLGDLDLADMPDLLTGFLTSRVVYTLIQYVLGELQTNVLPELVPRVVIDLNVKANNLGTGACRSIGISREFDFDPIWSSCALASAIAGILGCGVTALPTDCTNANLSPTPDWHNCDRVYGSGQHDPGAPVGLSLVDKSAAFDQDGVLLNSVIQQEGYMYYFLYAANTAHSGFTSTQRTCKVQPNPAQLVPGWDRILDVWSTQEGDPGFEEAKQADLPVTSLSIKRNYVVPFTSDGDLTFPDDSGILAQLVVTNQRDPSCRLQVCEVLRGSMTHSPGALDLCIKALPEYCGYTANFSMTSNTTSNTWACSTTDGIGSTTVDLSSLTDLTLQYNTTKLPGPISQALSENRYKLIGGTLNMNVSDLNVPWNNRCDFPLYALDADTCEPPSETEATAVVRGVHPRGRPVSTDLLPFWGQHITATTPYNREDHKATWSGCGDYFRNIYLVPIFSVTIDPVGNRPMGESCEFLITQRGTSSTYEWSVNFNAQMTPGYNVTDGAFVHRGYRSYTDAILPIIEEFIKREYLDSGFCDPTTSKLIITGHSLGGGLAEVFAHYVTNRDIFAGFDIQVVTFAPAHALSEAATEALKAHANVRSLVGEYDLIPNFPCANGGGVMRCPSRTAAALYGEGYDEPYGVHVNTIRIPAADMSILDGRYADLHMLHAEVFVDIGLGLPVPDPTITFQTPGPLNFAAWHVCSYACWTSANFCTTDANLQWMCANCASF